MKWKQGLELLKSVLQLGLNEIRMGVDLIRDAMGLKED